MLDRDSNHPVPARRSTVFIGTLAVAFLIHVGTAAADETSASPANTPNAPTSAADRERESWFETRIRPVLVDVCHRCHGGATTSGGLRIDSRAGLLKGGDSGPAIVAGEPDSSLLLRAIQRDADVSAMPPD
jgi:hypothetical protein